MQDDVEPSSHMQDDVEPSCRMQDHGNRVLVYTYLIEHFALHLLLLCLMTTLLMC